MQDTIHIKGIIETEIHHLNPLQHFIARMLSFVPKYQTLFVRHFGSLREQLTTYNTITNAGKAQLLALAGGLSATTFTYLGVGSSTTAPAATQTALTAEIVGSGMTRAAATVTQTTTTSTNDTLQLVKTFTSSATQTIEEAGVFNAATVGTMLGRGLTTSKALGSGDTLTITYKIVLS